MDKTHKTENGEEGKGDESGKKEKEPGIEFVKGPGPGATAVTATSPSSQLHLIPTLHNPITAPFFSSYKNVFQGWKNSVPKLYKYSPSDIEVVVYRKNGQVDTIKAAGAGTSLENAKGDNLSAFTVTPDARERSGGVNETVEEIANVSRAKLISVEKQFEGVKESLVNELPDSLSTKDEIQANNVPKMISTSLRESCSSQELMADVSSATTIGLQSTNTTTGPATDNKSVFPVETTTDNIGDQACEIASNARDFFSTKECCHIKLDSQNSVPYSAILDAGVSKALLDVATQATAQIVKSMEASVQSVPATCDVGTQWSSNQPEMMDISTQINLRPRTEDKFTETQHLLITDAKLVGTEPMETDSKSTETEAMVMEAKSTETEPMAVEAKFTETEKEVMEVKSTETEPVAMETKFTETEQQAMEVKCTETEPMITATKSTGTELMATETKFTETEPMITATKSTGTEPMVTETKFTETEPIKELTMETKSTETESIVTEAKLTETDPEPVKVDFACQKFPQTVSFICQTESPKLTSSSCQSFHPLLSEATQTEKISASISDGVTQTYLAQATSMSQTDPDILKIRRTSSSCQTSAEATSSVACQSGENGLGMKDADVQFKPCDDSKAVQVSGICCKLLERRIRMKYEIKLRQLLNSIEACGKKKSVEVKNESKPDNTTSNSSEHNSNNHNEAMVSDADYNQQEIQEVVRSFRQLQKETDELQKELKRILDQLTEQISFYITAKNMNSNEFIDDDWMDEGNPDPPTPSA